MAITVAKPSTAGESTQTSSVVNPQAGKLAEQDVDSKDRWTVESALADITPRYAESTSSPIPFIHLLERLKTTKRAGWCRFGIAHGESIADHMYRMSVLTLLAPASLASKLDVLKCCRMALVHDMAEALVGDITPVDNVSKAEKSRRETESMDYICAKLLGRFNGGVNGAQIRALWQEYEDGETLESLFVHDIDKVELIAQMVEYERMQGCVTDYGEFTWVAKKIRSAEVKAWTEELLWERMEMWRALGKEPAWAEGTKPVRRQEEL